MYKLCLINIIYSITYITYFDRAAQLLFPSDGEAVLVIFMNFLILIGLFGTVIGQKLEKIFLTQKCGKGGPFCEKKSKLKKKIRKKFFFFLAIFMPMIITINYLAFQLS